MKKLLLLIVMAGIFASCGNMDKKNESNNMASNDMAAKNEARVREFYEKVLNAHNADIVDQYCTTDFTDHQPAPEHSGKGTDDLRASFKEWFTMVPDVNTKIDAISSTGNNVWIKFTMTGTNTGSSPGMPATGKSFNVEGMEMITLNNEGKATDRWGYFEEMKWAQQLGMMPSHEEMMKNQKMAEESKMEKKK